MSLLATSFKESFGASMPKLVAMGMETRRVLYPPVDFLELSPDERIGLVAVP